MKLHSTDLYQYAKSPSKLAILVCAGLILFTIVSIHYPLLGYPLQLMKSLRSTGKCDIFSGEWVRDSNAPYYTNKSCSAIHKHQNCMKYGRPDLDFMKWRWKPDECELPIFNSTQFMEIVRGKSLAFVGDSMGRNQMQSLICLLSKVEKPVDVSYSSEIQSTRWKYTNHNFTIENFWSPFLVKTRLDDPEVPIHERLFHVYLDEFDESWTTKMQEFDYIVLSGDHWFGAPMIYYEKRRVVGCHFCHKKNVKEIPMFYGYKKAFQTAFRAINSLTEFKGITFLRTFSPQHFENGTWNDGGDCVRRTPIMSREARLEGYSLKLYRIQREEFRVAKRKKSIKFRLLDTTGSMLMRPDGHPSKYGHWPGEKVFQYNDCAHWCLPGPIDTWNAFLLEFLKTEFLSTNNSSVCS
ncbi:hypothetical protein ACHQM5_006857 [Ranunculus cassubicifolius]